LAWFRFGVRHRRVAKVLSSIFPVPADGRSEEEIEAWVRTTRRAWVEQEVSPEVDESDAAVIEAARHVAAYGGALS
jgi:hypothetical protein